LLSGGSARALRVQAAYGMLLLFAAGHGTRAPGRLLSLALGLLLLTRALLSVTPAPSPARSAVPRSSRVCLYLRAQLRRCRRDATDSLVQLGLRRCVRQT